MKIQITILFMGLFSIFGFTQKNNLTNAEIKLVSELNFKSDLFSELKTLTTNELKQLPAIDQETGDVLSQDFYNGVFSETSEEKAIEIVKSLKTKFKENGYLIFVYESENDKKNVAVIKGHDELDILRYVQTNGINYDLENEDVVNKISEWKSKFGLIVIGCSRDWLQVELDKLPTDLNAFANEVYEFCPDSVDQGVGTIGNLKQAIMEMKGVWLWWD